MKEPTKDQKDSSKDQKDPMKDPMKEPTKDQKDSTKDQKDPTKDQKDPTTDQKPYKKRLRVEDWLYGSDKKAKKTKVTDTKKNPAEKSAADDIFSMLMGGS
jgi:hypothetical protein